MKSKYRKRAGKIKWTDIEYHVQDNSDVAHKDLKMYFDINQFPTLPFCGLHPKPPGERGLGNNYHIRFDPNLGHGICVIHRIPFACVSCTSMLDQTWISGVQ